MIHLVELQRKSTPNWASKIDRWYQLDEISYAFCEAIDHWNYLEDQPKPDLIFLAVEGASNVSDLDFVQGHAASPAKFVYTLPNICASVIFQLLGHQGKIFCVHKGRESLAFAQSEAQQLSKQGKVVWVFSSPAVLESEKRQVGLAVFKKSE